MRVVFSEKVNELEKIISPYMDLSCIPCKLKEDAPDEIKQAYNEFIRISKEEYEKSMI